MIQIILKRKDLMGCLDTEKVGRLMRDRLMEEGVSDEELRAGTLEHSGNHETGDAIVTWRPPTNG